MIYEGDLSVFQAVVSTGGVSSAARHLGKVPSHVTTRIQILERELGVSLFHRTGKRLALSAHGRTFLGYAEELTRLHASARAALQESEPVGALCLGAMDSVAATRLPLVLSEFHRHHPRVSVSLVTGTTASLVERLEAGSIEAAVVADAPARPWYGRCTVSREELVLIAPAAHAVIRHPKDVRYHTCFAFGRGCAYRQRLETWLESGEITPARISELSSYHAILGCVAAGMGVALVPAVLLDGFPGRAALSLHALPKALRTVEVAVVWRKDDASARVKAFAEVVVAARAGKGD